jgi:hypothetical protein
MAKTRMLMIIAALGGASLGACNRQPDDANQKAVEAQNAANHEIAEAHRTADHDTADVKKNVADDVNAARGNYDKAVAEGNQKIENVHRDESQKVANAQAEANEKVRSANRDVSTENADLREWGQKKIDGLNDKIDDATAKAQKAAPQVRAEFQAGISDVQTKRDALIGQFASLDARHGDAVNHFKDRVSTQIDQLKDRVDRLEKRL